MRKIITLVALVITSSTHAQTVKKEYYDPYSKTQIMAEFQVNAAGEKSGYFKGYNEKGIVVVECNYLNNQQNGSYKEYSTYDGRKLSKLETYKAGVLDGPYKLYNGNLVITEGEYLNGQKHGRWIVYQPYANYQLSSADQKANEYFSSEIHYDNGKPIYPAGEFKMTYYPSGKFKGTETRTDSTRTIVFYLPDGKMESEQIFTGEKLVMEKLYYTSGKVKLYRDWRFGSFKYEGYDENGNPDRETIRQQKIQEALRLFNSKNFDKAAEMFTAAYEQKDAEISKLLSKAQKFYDAGDLIQAIKHIGLADEKADNPIINDMYFEVYPKFISWLDEKSKGYIERKDSPGFMKLLEQAGNIYKDEDFDRYSKIIGDM
jgi:antitoxin component YwqK of YwqJK toxin-antitoxin module